MRNLSYVLTMMMSRFFIFCFWKTIKMFIKSLLPFLAFGQRDDEDDGVQLGCSRVLTKTFCDFLKIDSNPVSSPDFKGLTHYFRKSLLWLWAP